MRCAWNYQLCRAVATGEQVNSAELVGSCSQRLPAKFARDLGARRDLKLRLAGGEMMPLWDVEVFADEKRGDMYLGRGWKKFARAHDLRDGYLLVFRYDDGAAALTVTVFDRSTCRKQYVHAGAAGTSPRPSSHLFAEW
jgi:hypothetical protein